MNGLTDILKAIEPLGLGDDRLYVRGDVVLINDDSMRVIPLLPTGCVHAVITDPPYGIDYQSARRIDRSQWKPKIANDGLPFVWWVFPSLRVAAEPSCCLCFCRWDVQEAFRLAHEWSGWDVKSQVIWDREAHGMGDLNGCPAPQHDVIWYSTKERFTFHGDRPKSVVRGQRLGGEELLHPNQKPESLMVSLVRDYTRADDLVADWFTGSGTTAIACIQTGRKFIGCELDPKHYATAVDRLDKEFKRLELLEPVPPKITQAELFQ